MKPRSAATASIIPFLSEAAFDPDTTQAMGEAFDKARRSLHDRGQPPMVQEIIAKRIIDIAKTGERNSDVLCERALTALGFDTR